MKNILLLVHDDAGQEARLQAALDITKRLDGHLTCLDVAVPPIAMIGDFYSGAGQAVLIDAEIEHEASNKAKIEARLANEQVPWNWVDTVGMIPDEILSASSVSDLIVLNSKLDGYEYPEMLNIVSRTVMHARRPVLAVPEESRRVDIGRALVAWDGQAACAATLRACTPLLALADEVEIFMVRDGAERTDPVEAAEYLSRHGVHPNIRVVDDTDTHPDELILKEADRWRADYVVMGAYGRGRLMEAFGGVTKRMLANSSLPLVLGH